jgi:hydrogenase/urease accessory protein HupE
MGRSGVLFGRGLPLVLPLILVLVRAVAAHPLSPSLLEVHERPDGVVAVRWKTPTLRMPGADLRPLLPADCRPTAPATTEEEPESLTARWTADCGPGGLVGRQIGVEGLDSRITDVLLHLELADGRSLQSVLRPREPSFIVPARERRLDVARRFAALGVEHIATGYDHLLFVFGLLLLVASTRTLVATITAFTLGHSLTLALAVLDVARVPAAPTEALIAASIFVLGVELARPPDAAPTLMRRHPSLLALAFGLLHGLGFAGALREAGLPSEAVPLALVSFNVGIELGQLVFVVAVLVIRRLAAPALRALPSWTTALPVYAVGSLAAFWTIERVAVLLPR